jgi:hypothetical protein
MIIFEKQYPSWIAYQSLSLLAKKEEELIIARGAHITTVEDALKEEEKLQFPLKHVLVIQIDYHRLERVLV